MSVSLYGHKIANSEFVVGVPESRRLGVIIRLC